jgi:hypothetical protein
MDAALIPGVAELASTAGIAPAVIGTTGIASCANNRAPNMFADPASLPSALFPLPLALPPPAPGALVDAIKIVGIMARL